MLSMARLRWIFRDCSLILFHKAANLIFCFWREKSTTYRLLILNPPVDSTPRKRNALRLLVLVHRLSM